MSDENQQEIRRGDFARKKGEVVLREHEYDGIQEFDQKLPNWWLFTFYGAIAWFVIHWCIYYYNHTIQTDQEKIISQVEALKEKKAAALEETLSKLNDESMMTDWVADPGVLANGLATYSTYCVACHAADLSGTLVVGETKAPLPGLPLNDGDWKYGAKPMDIFKLINEGTPPESPGHNGAKMQAWGQMLTPVQVAEVTAYVISENPDEFPAP
ncbi:hypothetical protein HAHE_39600 [Haloferula helveola]|uniref:Cytochrome c domain-containing protein n=1 Tax=Haloferula helveola TaxID=490095 RepID=A0ABM7RIP2_9BACT|nr:hypothetical protein HAHE_39600 [Haloferula helveola]